jgi:signal transduction histidine kinase
MDIKVALKNGLSRNRDKADKAAARDAASRKTPEGEPIVSDAQELLLKAQKDAELAKAVARQAISQAFKTSEASVKRAETLAKAFDDALQGSMAPVHPEDKESGPASAHGRASRAGLAKKLLNNGQNPLNAISDMTRSFFTSKTIDAETRKDFYDLVVRRSRQLRELVDDLVREQAQRKIEKAIDEAKSDRIASKLAVQQAQEELKRIREEAEEEVRNAREEARKAKNEVEASRRDAEEAINLAKGWVEKAKNETTAEKKSAEVMVSRAEQQAMSRAALEVKKAMDEVQAAKEAAGLAVKRAEVEVQRTKKEAEEAKNRYYADLSVAQERARQEAEKVEAIKQQTQVALDRALAEATRAKEEVATTRRESQQAVARARDESQKAIEETELVKRRLQETVIQAQQQSYQDICAEMNRIKEEAETTKKAAYDAIVRAQEESRKAQEEAGAVKQAAEEGLARAMEESRKAKEEAEKTKQALQEVVARAQEENRKIKEDAETSIKLANEAMKRARQDIIGMTIGEITKTRQELEAASQDPRVIAESAGKATAPAPPEPEPSSHVDGDYVAAVLHEMRAPLHSISGFANLMLEDGVQDIKTQKEFLSIVVQQSESLNRLIDDLSGLLSPDGETFRIDKQMVSPQKLITEAVKGAQGTASQKKNVIILSLPNNLPPVEADGQRIKQVLLNLINNAVKFSAENNAITVRAEAQNNELLVQVKDHGIGIPPAEMPSVFDEHYRASNCGGAAGQGLGLHICKEIVEAHGGRIWAESLEGQGSTFSFALPLVIAGS